MTFAEYNTDENFNKPSNAMELVRLGKAEGKTKDEILNALSPLWKEDKKGNVKKALDYHFSEKTEPTPEPEVKETAPAAPSKSLSKTNENFAAEQNAIVDAAEQEAQNKLKTDNDEGWKATYSAMENKAKAFKNIDDHYIENLPKTILGAYKAGEFGDVGSKEAKQRLAYFMVDNFANVLKAFSNAAAANAGRGPVFSDIENQWDKMQKTNLANAMENRWKKYEADTQSAIELASKQSMTEQEATNTVNEITRNRKMNTYWNMMDEKQKLFTLEVTKEIGDYIGDMDLGELANFIAGSAYKGDMNKDEVVAIGIAKLAAETPDLIKNLPEGDVKTKVLAMISSISGNKVPDLKDVVAGVGGAGGNNEGTENPNPVIDEKKTNNKITNPMGNLKGYKALDGKVYDWDTWEDKEGKNDLARLTQDLSDKFYNGEIDADTFMSYYTPLYNEGKKHTGVKINAPSDVMKANVEKKLKDLNKETKSGKVTVNDYGTKTAEIIAMAQSAGLSAGDIEKLKKDFIDSSKIKYKGPLAK